jgi:pimeloyl-ACP methyl ester carboxylesterase
MNLREAADKIAGAGTTVAIAWLDYDSPGNPVAGLGWGAAEDGGDSLVGFVNILRRNFSGRRITVVGHSYGSAVVAEAVKRGLKADDAVVTGTFGGGIGVTSAASTGYGGHLYVGHAKDDTGVTVGEITHGPNQTTYADARWLDVGSASGHNEYYDRGSRSLRSIAAVVTGRAAVVGHDNGRDLWGLPS